MSEVDIKQLEVQQRIADLLETLIQNKPNDRSELDKVYAVAITDVQKICAWWDFAFHGLPPFDGSQGAQ